MGEISIKLFDGASEIIKKIFGPSADEIGQTLGAITGCLVERFDKYKYYNEARKQVVERNYRNLSDSLNEIPESKRCTVPPELAEPIMDRLSYVSNEKLGALFIRLLTNASSSSGAIKAHPGFIRIIDSLSSDEAKIIQAFLPGIQY